MQLKLKSPSAVELDEIIAVGKEHFNPTPQKTVQRFKINSRSREKREIVANFVAALRHLVIHCQFGDNLNEPLRDRLIQGIIEDKHI